VAGLAQRHSTRSDLSITGLPGPPLQTEYVRFMSLTASRSSNGRFAPFPRDLLPKRTRSLAARLNAARARMAQEAEEAAKEHETLYPSDSEPSDFSL